MRKIHRDILRLAWPAITTNITTPLLSLVDVAIVGHIQGGSLIAAVAVGGTVLNIVYWLFGFLRMGTSGMSAQALGARDALRQRLVFMRGITVAIAGAILIFSLTPFFGHKAIELVSGGETSTADSWLYFRLAILGAPGVLITNVVSGWLLGLQHPRSIMWVALTTNLLNIALSSFLVFVLHLGIVGVALGTAISQIVGATIGLMVVHRIMTTLKESNGIGRNIFRKIFRDKNDWKAIFRINSDIFLRTLCLSTVTLWFTHAGALYGETTLAANALLMQLFMVFSYFMDGFAFGGEALAGNYFGARDFDTLRMAVRALFKWGIATSLLFTVLYFVAGDVFLTLLTDDTDVIVRAKEFILWAVLVPLAGFTAFTWDGILIGMTRTRYLLLSMLISMIVFFGIYYGGTAWSFSHCGKNIDSTGLNHILWLAFIVYLAIRGVVSTVLYRRFMKRQDTARKINPI